MASITAVATAAAPTVTGTAAPAHVYDIGLSGLIAIFNEAGKKSVAIWDCPQALARVVISSPTALLPDAVKKIVLFAEAYSTRRDVEACRLQQKLLIEMFPVPEETGTYIKTTNITISFFNRQGTRVLDYPAAELLPPQLIFHPVAPLT